LLDANRVISTDRLADQLWAGQPPLRAAGTLQAYVSRLRRVLDPDHPAPTIAGLLATRPTGYVLQVAADQIDAGRFERLAEQGRAALAAGEPAVALDRLDQALALWRGPALADLAEEPFAGPAVHRLEELRLGATEDRLEAALALGRHGSIVADLESLVASHPLRERPWGQLMLALYRSERQAESLRAYQ